MHKIHWFSRLLFLAAGLASAAVPPVTVGVFSQEVRKEFTTSNGLPSNDVTSVAIGSDGTIYAATASGIARWSGQQWSLVAAQGEPVRRLAAAGGQVWWIAGGALSRWDGQKAHSVARVPDASVFQLSAGDEVMLATDRGLYILHNGSFVLDRQLASLLGADPQVRQIAFSQDRVAVAADAGLFLREQNRWRALYPRQGERNWAPRDVRGVAFDTGGRLWFASPQGVGCRGRNGEWSLYTGRDGVPYLDFTTAASGGDHAIWFGTTMGAIRFDGKSWEYRQGRRWLLDDKVRAIAVDGEGNAWFAGSQGVTEINRKPMTFAQKARFFEDDIDKRHRRTPYGFIAEVKLKRPGDISEWTQRPADSDALWISMYGAGECFDYAVTKDPKAKERADKAFEALRFLRLVTQGGPYGAPPGYTARSILPTSAPDPNIGGVERDKAHVKRDYLWKVLPKRWPTSADGKWYWHTDNSSDQLDGQFFFYACYYDLAADAAERSRVVEQVTAIMDHLLKYNFRSFDYDGKPTRWAIFDPEDLNHNLDWGPERSLNSLSILSYLKVAEHITGLPRYAQAEQRLIQKDSYAANAMIAKTPFGPGSGNQSDDEMYFMDCYNLIRYETNARLRKAYAYSMYQYWLNEEPEMNPLFNFIYAALCKDVVYRSPDETRNLSPKGHWLDDSIDTLRRLPLDLVEWRLTNSHRADIVLLPPVLQDENVPRGFRTNGKVLPVDERILAHWNADPWKLDEGGSGMIKADGATFLLPYYMGLYEGYLR